LLKVPGDNEAAINLNRRGNEYFLKFRPLVDIIIQEKAIPKSYKVMSLVQALRPLLDYISESIQQNIVFGEVEF